MRRNCINEVMIWDREGKNDPFFLELTKDLDMQADIGAISKVTVRECLHSDTLSLLRFFSEFYGRYSIDFAIRSIFVCGEKEL